METKKIPFTTICARLERAIHADVGMRGLKILIYGWQSNRMRKGFIVINFRERRYRFGEEFMTDRELSRFSLYCGYDLTRD